MLSGQGLSSSLIQFHGQTAGGHQGRPLPSAFARSGRPHGFSCGVTHHPGHFSYRVGLWLIPEGVTSPPRPHAIRVSPIPWPPTVAPRIVSRGSELNGLAFHGIERQRSAGSPRPPPGRKHSPPQRARKARLLQEPPPRSLPRVSSHSRPSPTLPSLPTLSKLMSAWSTSAFAYPPTRYVRRQAF